MQLPRVTRGPARWLLAPLVTSNMVAACGTGESAAPVAASVPAGAVQPCRPGETDCTSAEVVGALEELFRQAGATPTEAACLASIAGEGKTALDQMSGPLSEADVDAAIACVGSQDRALDIASAFGEGFSAMTSDLSPADDGGPDPDHGLDALLVQPEDAPPGYARVPLTEVVMSFGCAYGGRLTICDGSTRFDVANFTWTEAPHDDARWSGSAVQGIGEFASPQAAMARWSEDAASLATIADLRWSPLVIRDFSAPAFGLTIHSTSSPRCGEDCQWVTVSQFVETVKGRYLVTIEVTRQAPLGRDPTPPLSDIESFVEAALSRLPD